MLQETLVGINANKFVDGIVATFDEFPQYKCITPTQHIGNCN